MSFNFPVPTAVDEVYTDPVSGLSYTWNGTMWKMGVSAAATNPYVLKTGDAMTGALVLPTPDPTTPPMATHKAYVDRLIAEMSLYQGTWQVAANIPNLNVPPNAPLNGYSWTAQTADPNIPEMAPLTIPGIGGRSIAALDTIKWSEALQAYEHIQGPVGVSQMTIADTPPAGGFHGQQWWDSNAGKNYVFYVDPSGDGVWVQTSGGGGSSIAEAPDDGVIYGRQNMLWAAVVTAATIISDTAPVTPGVGQLWWNSSTGNLSIWTGTEWVQANVEEAPVDGQEYTRVNADWAVATAAAGGVAEAPQDGTPYSRQDAGWVATVAGTGGAFLPLTGGTVTGPLNVAEGPLTLTKTSTFPGGDPNGAMLVLNRTDPAQGVGISAQNAGVESWKIILSSGEISGIPGYGDQIQFIRSNAVQFEMDASGNVQISGNLTIYGTFTDALGALAHQSELAAANDRIAQLEARLQAAGI